jgi:hypothetical protein
MVTMTKTPVKPKFEPITITVETEEEAEFLWHILNNADLMGRIQSRFWCALQPVYKNNYKKI